MAPSPVWLLGRSFLVSSLYLLAIVTIHVRGDSGGNETAFVQRLQQGPSALSHWDLLLFAVVITISFEIMSYIALHSGGWMGAKRIPVRGKHLDDLSTVGILLGTIQQYWHLLTVSSHTPHTPPPDAIPHSLMCPLFTSTN